MIIQDFLTKKQKCEKISMITCYDYSFASLIDKSTIDAILVGDSAAMVMHGEKTTLNISTEIMALHTRSVVRGAPHKFIVSDMPFMSYRKSLDTNITCIEEIMKAGAHAIKLEGAAGNLELIRHTVQSGVPVMGHLGLTPQSVNNLGGFKVQGREKEAHLRIVQEASQLQDAGCFSVVLECVPSELASEISAKLEIPVIGIGAGVKVDGQVLVLQDMLGFNDKFKPTFLRQYLNGSSIIQEALNRYHQDVVSQKFPNEKESYT